MTSRHSKVFGVSDGAQEEARGAESAAPSGLTLPAFPTAPTQPRWQTQRIEQGCDFSLPSECGAWGTITAKGRLEAPGRADWEMPEGGQCYGRKSRNRENPSKDSVFPGQQGWGVGGIGLRVHCLLCPQRALVSCG